MTSQNLTVSTLGVSNVEQLGIPQLASTHGGPVAVHSTPDGRLEPVEPPYALSADVLAYGATANRFVSGWLLIDAEPQSIANWTWSQALRVLVREAGL